MKVLIKSEAVRELEREAELLGVSGAAVARAIISTVVSEGLVPVILAGVDVDAMEPRGRQRQYARYEFRGGMYSVEELAQMSGLPASTIRNRLTAGMTAEKALMKADLRRAGA